MLLQYHLIRCTPVCGNGSSTPLFTFIGTYVSAPPCKSKNYTKHLEIMLIPTSFRCYDEFWWKYQGRPILLKAYQKANHIHLSRFKQCDHRRRAVNTDGFHGIEKINVFSCKTNTSCKDGGAGMILGQHQDQLYAIEVCGAFKHFGIIPMDRQHTYDNKQYYSSNGFQNSAILKF